MNQKLLIISLGLSHGGRDGQAAGLRRVVGVDRAIAPVAPQAKVAQGGRPPVDDRAALCGIIFVLRTGIPWEYLPQEMGCGSGMTCWRRLRDWQRAGVWRRLHQVLLERLNAAGKIDWSRGVVDSASVRALHGGKKRARAR